MSARAAESASTLDPWKIPLVGTSFIEASAGTGKTHALTTLYLRLLIEQDLGPADILVVTFTEAATAELRERIRDRIRAALGEGEGGLSLDVAGEARLRRALRDFDEAAIFTIHGFCQRTLKERAFESGLAFEAELVEKPEQRKRTLAHDLWTRLLADEDDEFRAWLTTGPGRRRWSFEPESLFKLIHEQLGADDAMPILPERPPAIPRSMADLEEDVDRGWRAFAESWASRREQVTALLLDKKQPFHGNVYKSVTIQTNWVPALDALASEISASTGANGSTAPLALEVPDFLEKLTPDGLRKPGRMTQKRPPPEDPFFDVCGALVAADDALEAALDDRALALRRRFVEEVRAADERRRREDHVLYFDDLLSELRRALTKQPEGERLAASLRARYRFALIDEFQDTDAVQYEIFGRVWHGDATRAAGGGLVLIGDPKQAIYSFRGADVHTYLAARGGAGAKVHTLDVNHRSDPPVVAAVNALFEAARLPFAPAAIEFKRVSPTERARKPFGAAERYRAGLRVSFLAGEAVKQLAPHDVEKSGEIALRFARTRGMKALARDVAELLESKATIGDRALVPSDIAILARRKSELDQVRRALEALGIPSVSRIDESVFEAREAWELSSVLAAWLHPGDGRRLRAALSSAAHGFDARAIAALDDDSSELAAIAERFADYGRLWSQAGFARAFETWRTKEGITERLLALVDGDRRLTNWLHLAELLARIASERGGSRTGLVDWLDRAIADEATRLELGADAGLLRLERDDEAVQLVTLHGSKGLEYEIVYLPCLWEGFERRGVSEASVEKGGARPPVRFADPDANGRRTLDLGIPGPDYPNHLALARMEAAAEQLRLLYVGLTRAKRQCVVFWGRIGQAYAKSPLTRLLFDATAIDERDAKGAKGDYDALRDRTDDDWRAAWQKVAERSGGAVRIEECELALRDPWQAPEHATAALDFEPPHPLSLRLRATTSFSGLVRHAQRPTAVVAGPLATGRDLDAEQDASPRADEPDADLAGAMHAFPRGAEAGTLLHEVLERADFTAFAEEGAGSARAEAEVEALAFEWLGRSGLDRGLASQVVHVVRSVATTPLRSAPSRLRLADVAKGQLRAELEFTLAAPGDAEGRGFSAPALAKILAEAPAGSPLERYAERAASLAWPALSGHLRGFVDAVFCDGERYFVIDYKSNHLGSCQVDYRPDRLVAPMIDHDYVLQYLLYTVALDRHLARRLVDYDYERHCGGAYYLFLRGMAPGHAPDCGIFFDRPDRETVRRVSALLGAPRGEAP